MSLIVKKKNLRARKGTQRWRRNIEVINQNDDKVEFPQQDRTLTYEINDTQKNIYENKDRFKKKPVDPKLLSKNE